MTATRSGGGLYADGVFLPRADRPRYVDDARSEAAARATAHNTAEAAPQPPSALLPRRAAVPARRGGADAADARPAEIEEPELAQAEPQDGTTDHRQEIASAAFGPLTDELDELAELRGTLVVRTARVAELEAELERERLLTQALVARSPKPRRQTDRQVVRAFVRLLEERKQQGIRAAVAALLGKEWR